MKTCKCAKKHICLYMCNFQNFVFISTLPLEVLAHIKTFHYNRYVYLTNIFEFSLVNVLNPPQNTRKTAWIQFVEINGTDVKCYMPQSEWLNNLTSLTSIFFVLSPSLSLSSFTFVMFNNRKRVFEYLMSQRLGVLETSKL